jgi:hypothetical protein
MGSIRHLLLALIATVGLTSSRATASPWVVTKESWTANDEQNYSTFVEQLGNSRCNTIERCLKGAANPYRASDDPNANFWTDCAKFPYLLRAYFAWKNELPFSFVNSVRSAAGGDTNLRYSIEGNVVSGRRTLAPRPGQEVDGMRALNVVQNQVSTAMFRIHPRRDNVATGKFQDFYSTRIDRRQIRPGTVIYDPAGHVAVVYRIETDGRVRYIDAHPDSTITRSVYGDKFSRARPGSGAGFKNFRSLKLVNGVVTAVSLNETVGYSEEQYFGTETGGAAVPDANWQRARFVIGGSAYSFQDFVRARLAGGVLKFRPLEELKNGMESLCGDIRDRVIAVDTALTSGLQHAPHPERLPLNIYGSSGPWEEYASPSRDARLKIGFVELRRRVTQMIEMYRRGDSRIEYSGRDLLADLRAVYQQTAQACNVSYRRSDGSSVRLEYDEIAKRLFALSFDPYHCAERRWGARSTGELATCVDDSHEKQAWYRAEQRLRNQTERTYDVRMDFSLADLERRAPGSGVDQAPNVDLKALLRE